MLSSIYGSNLISSIATPILRYRTHNSFLLTNRYPGMKRPLCMRIYSILLHISNSSSGLWYRSRIVMSWCSVRFADFQSLFKLRRPDTRRTVPVESNFPALFCWPSHSDILSPTLLRSFVSMASFPSPGGSLFYALVGLSPLALAFNDFNSSYSRWVLLL